MPYIGTEAQKATNSITSSLDDVDAVIGRLFTYVERLEEIEGKILGPHPTEVRPGGGVNQAAMPHSIIASINERRSALVVIADRLERALGNIGNAL